MSQVAFYPYPFGHGALTLTCEFAGVDSERTPSGSLLLLDDIPHDGRLQLRLQVALSPGTLELVVPPEEVAQPPCRVGVVLRSVPARMRRLVEVTAIDAQAYETRVELPRRDLHVEFSLTPVLVRTSEGPSNGFAGHLGAILADGDPVQVLLEEPPTPPGGYLDIEFESFPDSANRIRRANPDALLSIDVAGDFPKLWLNSGVTSLYEVMTSRARRGATARIRDAMYQSIAGQVWTSLVFASVEGLASALRDGIEGRAALDELPDWQKRVVNFWAPRLLHGYADQDQAIDEVCRMAGSVQGMTELHELAVPAIQRWSQAKPAFTGMLRLVTGEGI